jgi:hypothetical protein
MAGGASRKSAKTKLHPAEEAMLRAFVASSQRDRLLALFRSPGRRKEALDALNHVVDWDARFARPVDS